MLLVDIGELRRGVLEPCVLALVEQRPRFGLELVRDLAAANGLLTSEGTIYPLLNRLRDRELVQSDWQVVDGERPRRYYQITDRGRQAVAEFRLAWTPFCAAVDGVIGAVVSADRLDNRTGQS